MEKLAHDRAALVHRVWRTPPLFLSWERGRGLPGSGPDLPSVEDAIGTVRFSEARLQTLIARGNAIAIGAFSRGARVIG